MRVALLTLASVISDAASLAFARGLGRDLVLLGLSDPAGRGPARLRAALARSGPAMLAYLLLGYGVPFRRGPHRDAAAAAGAAFVHVPEVNGPAFRAALRQAAPDLIVTLHFDQILAPETLALARLGGINLHPSLLPRHRGPIPAFWALAEGRGETGVSIHRLVARIDAGAVLAQRPVALPEGVSALEAARLLHLAGLDPLRQALRALAEGRADPAPAPEPLPYRPFPDRAAIRAAAARGVRLVRAGDLRLLRNPGLHATAMPPGR